MTDYVSVPFIPAKVNGSITATHSKSESDIDPPNRVLKLLLIYQKNGLPHGNHRGGHKRSCTMSSGDLSAIESIHCVILIVINSDKEHEQPTFKGTTTETDDCVHSKSTAELKLQS